MKIVFTITGRCQFYAAEPGELWREVSQEVATAMIAEGAELEYR